MAKAPAKDPFRCVECGWSATKWVGRCGECQAWGTVEEISAPKKLSLVAGNVTTAARPIGDVDLASAKARSSGVGELDRVLGGGLVPGAAILLAGEPGVGKSTLLLTVAAETAKQGILALYISGEESASQVRLRAERLKAIDKNLWLAAESDLGAVIAQIDSVKPELLVIDSIQTISSSTVDGAPGGVTQVREIAAALIRIAKERSITLVLVGHVTKDGSIAGPRLLEHLVDVVLNFEGERHSRLRLIRAIKNRFGASDEVGCFDLNDSGIVGLADPTGLFTSRHTDPVPGTCVTVTVEGKRPLIAEVQALVVKSSTPQPRRVTNGVDSARVAMLLAVLERRAGLRLSDMDVYVSTVGGVRLTEPAADLAIALAIASAVQDKPIAHNLVAYGEISLAGEIRKVTNGKQRASEATRLGFIRSVDSEVGDLRAALALGLNW